MNSVNVSISMEWKQFWFFIWHANFSTMTTRRRFFITLSIVSCTFSAFLVPLSLTAGGANLRQFFICLSFMQSEVRQLQLEQLKAGICRQGLNLKIFNFLESWRNLNFPEFSQFLDCSWLHLVLVVLSHALQHLVANNSKCLNKLHNLPSSSRSFISLSMPDRWFQQLWHQFCVKTSNASEWMIASHWLLVYQRCWWSHQL